MKILMVVHQFLPRHLAGSEVYTYRLAQALRSRGHHVDLFFTEIHPERRQYELTRGTFDGIPYFEAVHNRSFASLRHSYWDPAMDTLFEEIVRETAPDVVHFQHLYLHSIGYIDIARQRRIPTLYTLHEFMLMCLNGGLLLRPGSIVCQGPDVDACARCATVAYPGVPAGSGIRDFPRPFDRLATAARRALRRVRRARPADGATRAHRDSVRRRRSEIQTQLDKVDLFVSPSRFLRTRFIHEGLVRPERIIASDNGFFVQPFVGVQKRPRTAGVLRVGYLGTIAEYKGVHLILDAFRGIHDPHIECRIYGEVDTFPDYKETLLGRGIPAGIRFMGRIANEQVAEALADIDLLIVPSLWPENSPLTIHEAFLSSTPVLVADFGGMAELVEAEKSGLHFRTGDATDLRRQLLRVLHAPDLLERLRRHVPPIKTIEQDAAQMEDRYVRLLRGERPLS